MTPDPARDEPLFAFGDRGPDAAERLVEEYGHLLAGERGTDPMAVDATVRAFLEYATRAHALAVVGELVCEDGPLRFSDFQERLSVSPKTLSARLAELVEGGFAVRRSYDEIPPRVEYELTRKARDLRPVFEFLYGWAATYDLDAWTSEE